MSDVFYNAMVLREPYSGVEVTVHQLACALAEYGAVPLTVCTPREHRPIPASPHVRLRVSHTVVPRSRLLRILWEQTVLPVLLRRSRAPLVHAPAYVAPLAAPCPVVLTIHDLHIMTHPQFCRKATVCTTSHDSALDPQSRRGHRLLPLTRRIILDRFPEARDRTVVIPPGLSPALTRCDDFARAAGRPPALPTAGLVLLFVGDLTYRKNILGLISAFAIVQGERPDLHLVLAGAARPRSGGRVRPGHPQTRRPAPRHADRIRDVRGPSRALLARPGVRLPSHDEGFGLPPLEAMACGCPVVCSGGAPVENCGSAAVTCDPREPASIAGAVSLLLDHPDFGGRRSKPASERPPSSRGRRPHVGPKPSTGRPRPSAASNP
jgi:glycosyltransferase involved in cell wall biosynthesis